MASNSLQRLLRPTSVAVIGGGWGTEVVAQLRKAAFEGDVWPVHPHRHEVAGLRAYPSLDALPGVPDAAWIGVNRDATIEIVRDLRERGAGGAVCFASGFGESGDGADRNAALLSAAGDMPILGPNCYGLLNYLDGAALWPDQHGGQRVERGVAILTQSSNMAINLTMQRRGLPIAYMLTAGNQAQMGLAELAEAVLADERVTAIGLHIEGIGDAAAFEALAAAARLRRIPIVALKIGRSEQARAATISHTASLAGSDAGSKAFFRRLGIPLVESLPALLETLKLLHVAGPLEGRALLSMSCSGGEASLIADAATGHNLQFPAFASEAKAAIAATLNPLVTVANPLDYHTFSWGDAAAMTATFAAAMAPGFDLSMLILDFPRDDRCSEAAWDPAVDSIIAAHEQTRGVTAVVASLPDLMPEARAAQLMAAGVVPLCGIDDAISAASVAATIGEAWATALADPILPVAEVTVDGTVLDEAESKRRLGAFGVPIPHGTVVSPGDEFYAPPTPLAIKAVGIAHKTEASAVRLGACTKAEIDADIAAMAPLGKGVLVEAMIQGGVAELIVGVTRDPAYGLLLTIGAGGTLTELLADTETLLLPARDAEIERALHSLRIAPILSGYRGKPAADIPAAVHAIAAVARYAEAHADSLLELDVNPLIVCERGAFAADALIRLVE